MDVWRAVEERRIALAERVGGLDSAQWDAPSWCEGWRVRDVFAHLVHLAEATQWSMTRDLLANGVAPNKALDRVARRLADEPQSELASRLTAAADGRYHVVGSPAAVALGEVITHAADLLLLLANRSQSIDCLAGPGVAALQ